MNHRNSILLLLLIILSSCASNKSLTKSQWKTNFSDVAPSLEEGYQTFPQTTVIVKTYNNSDALCIYIRFPDIRDQLRILQDGLTVWVDITAHKKENFGVVFSPANMPMAIGESAGFNISELIQHLNHTGAKIMKDDKELKSDKPFFTVASDKNHNLNYIITLPFSKMGVTTTLGKTMSIGVFSEDQKTQSKQMHDRKNDESEEDEILKNSNNMRGNLQNGGNNERYSEEENSEIRENTSSQLKGWIKISLASGPY
jgi:hypothetical protein